MTNSHYKDSRDYKENIEEYMKSLGFDIYSEETLKLHDLIREIMKREGADYD